MNDAWNGTAVVPDEFVSFGGWVYWPAEFDGKVVWFGAPIGSDGQVDWEGYGECEPGLGEPAFNKFFEALKDVWPGLHALWVEFREQAHADRA